MLFWRAKNVRMWDPSFEGVLAMKIGSAFAVWVPLLVLAGACGPNTSGSSLTPPDGGSDTTAGGAMNDAEAATDSGPSQESGPGARSEGGSTASADAGPPNPQTDSSPGPGASTACKLAQALRGG